MRELKLHWPSWADYEIDENSNYVLVARIHELEDLVQPHDDTIEDYHKDGCVHCGRPLARFTGYCIEMNDLYPSNLLVRVKRQCQQCPVLLYPTHTKEFNPSIGAEHRKSSRLGILWQKYTAK